MCDDIALPPVIGGTGGARVHNLGNENRHVDKGGGKDDRNNAGLVDLQRQVGRGTTVLTAANHALGVLDRNAALALFDEGNANNQDDQAGYHHGEDESTIVLQDAYTIGWKAGCDTSEDEQGHTVTDALFGDKLAHPHHQHGARRHGDYQDDEGKEVTVFCQDLYALAQQLLAVCQCDDAGGL